MKNIQVIDGAKNSTFDIYQIPDELFDLIFPQGTDIAFLDEVECRGDKTMQKQSWNLLYHKKVPKKQVVGIHGTLHLTGSYCSREFFPTRHESDAV